MVVREVKSIVNIGGAEVSKTFGKPKEIAAAARVCVCVNTPVIRVSSI